ncbi:MAG: AtpZ/AtpI family protein [Planctomycetota bacterium]|jgi:F0F1-type ATP synthase assembly protein I
MSQRQDPLPSAPSGDADEQRPVSTMRGIGAGYTLLASVLVGLLIGWLIDDHYGTAPYWTAGMAGLFICAGLYQVVKENWRQ